MSSSTHLQPELLELRDRIRQRFCELQEQVEARYHTGAVIELLRTMDTALLCWHTYGEWPENWVRTIRFGIVRTLSLFVPEAAKSAPIKDHAVGLPAAEWARTVLLEGGSLSVASLLADYVATGLASIETPDSTSFRICALETPGVEALDRADLEWIQDRITTYQVPEEVDLTNRFPEIRDRITSAMDQKTDQEELDEELTDYYEQYAVLMVERMVGYEYLPNEVSLGGIDFLTYKYAVVLLVRWALVRSGWLRVALENAALPYTSLQARAGVALVYRRDELVEAFSEPLGLNPTLATQIVEMLTLDSSWAQSESATIPNAEAAPFVAVGHDHFAMSLYGCLDAPFQFLLTRIKAAFPRDWTAAMNKTEAAFREELYMFFPGDRFLCIDRGIKLRSDGREVTDIDAFILDRETGAAGLFQLKWWFPYGASMKKRRSAARNLDAQARRWVDGVQGWLQTNDLSQFAAMINLRRRDRQLLRSVRLFILGRNFAHFTGLSAPDEVALGNWGQVVRLASDISNESSPVDALWHRLREDSPHHRITPAHRREILDFQDFHVSFEV